jgi:hypothetical protein
MVFIYPISVMRTEITGDGLIDIGRLISFKYHAYRHGHMYIWCLIYCKDIDVSGQV